MIDDPVRFGNPCLLLNDGARMPSIGGDDINQVPLPYTIHIHGLATMAPDARERVTRFAELIADLKAERTAVDLVFE